MSHSRFRRTSGLYLDMHGLIFETSICYWQDQPGISFLTCLASVTRATIFQPALTQESRESPPLRELAFRKRRIETNTTDATSRCRSARVRAIHHTRATVRVHLSDGSSKPKHSLSRSSVWFFKDLSFGHGARDSDSFDRSFFFWFAFLLRHIMSVYREKT